MLIERSIKVTKENGVRPAGLQDRCFYCGQHIGENHKDDCVCVVKVVMVKVEMTIAKVVPASWQDHMVNFHLNDSGWCADNFAQDLERYMDARGDDGPCLCGVFSGEYVRDATTEDVDGLDVESMSKGR
jgi:hypothetical protein